MDGYEQSAKDIKRKKQHFFRFCQVSPMRRLVKPLTLKRVEVYRDYCRNSVKLAHYADECESYIMALKTLDGYYAAWRATYGHRFPKLEALAAIEAAKC